MIAVVLCFGLGGIGYAEEGQAGQKSPEQAVKAEQLGMPEIVVTATRTKEEASKTPAKVEVVKSEQLKVTNVATADQGLTALPGVVCTREEGPTGLTSPLAFSSGIALRGFSTKQTMVLVDGQPFNNYESNPQWWSIPTETIDHVEVVKGPFSSLYGGWGVGGVVHVITKTEWVPLAVSITKGTYDYTGIAISSGFRLNDVTYHVAYDRKSVGPVPYDYIYNRNVSGVQIPTANGQTSQLLGTQNWTTEIDNLEFGANWDITMDSSIGLKIINSTFDQEPEKGSALPGATQRVNGSWVPLTDDDVTNSEFTRAHGSRVYNLSYYNKMLKNAEFNANFGLIDNYEDYYLGKNDPAAFGESNRPNTRYSLGGQVNFTMPCNNILSVGFDASQYRIDSEDNYFITYPQYSKGKMRTAGIFVQDEWKAADFLILYAGARFDYWKVYQADWMSRDTTTKAIVSGSYEDHDKSYVSPKVSVVILPDAKTTIRATAGDAFRSPAIWDLYSFSYYPNNTSRIRNLPNPDLDPETARCYEAGIERFLTDKLTVGGTYFSNHIDDMIYKVDLGSTAPTETQYQNVAKAYSKGYELTLRYKVSDALTVFANQTHTNTKITDVGDSTTTSYIEGKEFKDSPSDVYKFGGKFKQDKFFTDVFIQYMGDSYYQEDNSDTMNDAYEGNDPHTTVDVTVGYDFFKNCSVSASVFNVSDVKYWEGITRNTGRTYLVKGTLSF